MAPILSDNAFVILSKNCIQSVISCTLLILIVLVNFSQISCEVEDTTFLYNTKTSTSEPYLPLKPIEVPAQENHTGTIIFIHDFNVFAHRYVKDIKKINIPYMKVIGVSANIYPMQKPNAKYFPSWFEFTDPTTEDIQGTAYVKHLINEEIRHGIPAERIILAGIAQGGALALHVGLSYPKRLGAIVGFSSWQPYKITIDKHFNEVNRNIPIFNVHVYENQIIRDDEPVTANLELKEQVSKNVKFKIYNGKGAITDEEFKDVLRFCKEKVPEKSS